MAIHDLPDMYALSPRSYSPWASGIHIRQIPHAHVTTITCNPLDSFYLRCESVTCYKYYVPLILHLQRGPVADLDGPLGFLQKPLSNPKVMDSATKYLDYIVT